MEDQNDALKLAEPDQAPGRDPVALFVPQPGLSSRGGDDAVSYDKQNSW
jgi:hypothetical protein